jgi:hypothetical protein
VENPNLRFVLVIISLLNSINPGPDNIKALLDGKGFYNWLKLKRPLIIQNIISAGIGTLTLVRLPRFHRAGPSTSLDKSAVAYFGC